MMLVHFGQIIAEDIGSTADILMPRPCCDASGKLQAAPLDPMCYYIPIEKSDPTYALQPRECMNLLRTTTDISSNCPGYVHSGGAANQLNIVTAYIDQSSVYGSGETDLQRVRLYKDGLLKTFTIKGLEYPVYSAKEHSLCPEDDITGRCFVGGDFRANAYLNLATLHFIFIREHNRLARELKKINPHWCDDRIFEEARKINAAILQHIGYYQYLPEVLGSHNMKVNRLIFDVDSYDYTYDYDPSVNPGLSHEFAQAGYRHFHHLVRGDTP